MLISYKLLKSYIDLEGLSIKEITDKLTLSGFELEGINTLASATNLVIGEVISCENHPNSDHLHVTSTSIGNETIQIVCGAPNCRKGLKVIVALPGANLPAKGITIESGEIRGVKSNGMLCSLLELGVNPDTLTEYQKDGIEELPQDAIVGNTDVLGYLGLDDVIIDLSVTPNRSDVFAINSLIKEIAAILNRKIIKVDEYPLTRKGEGKYTCSSDSANCDYFSITEINDIVIKPSPSWMVDILHKHGIKSIDNVVDIGNYVTLMTGQPLHMYDADKLKSNKFIVKDDIDGSLIALDGKKYDYIKGDLLVTCGDIPVCMAGVMGDASSMIDENTSNIALEAALFNGVNVAASARRFGLSTVAATNYSKNAVDRYNTLKASDMACSLLVQYADAKCVSKAYEYDKRNLKNKEIEISLKLINDRLGTKLTYGDVEDVFDRLTFKYERTSDMFNVSVPTYRNDLEIPEDLIEEVIRIVGYDKVPFTMSPLTADKNGLSEQQKKRRMIDNYLLDNGLTNTLSYTLINKEDATYYGGFDNEEYIVLPHPLTVEKEYLRKNMICSMLKTVSYNQARGIKDVAIYEITHVYTNQHQEGVEKLSIAISNGFNNTLWRGKKTIDFYTIKGLVEGLLNIFGIEANRYMFEPIDKVFPHQVIFHPGKSAILKVNGKNIGIVGEIHPTTLKKEGIDPTLYFELDLTTFFDIKTSKAKYATVSKFPPMSRDIALVLKDEVSVSDLIKSIKRAGGPLLNKVEVFDVYKGEHVKDGYKSVALTMTFVDQSKTLVDAIVNDLFNKIYEQCQKDFNAVIR